MKTIQHAILAGLLTFSGTTGHACISKLDSSECRQIQCLSFPDEVKVDAAIYLQDNSVVSEALKAAFKQVRETDSSYEKKDNNEIAADIITNSKGSTPGW
ncbi:hypothetical protein [Bdellovibrio sp. HCB337]|uniref:hypothetical protein n=1 Tax=Bdellovibrio sp. HCB337 TaxID=3394358 RepID=UPI0039A6A151